MSIDEFVERGDAVVGEEVVIGGNIQAWAWATNVIRPRSDKVVCFITGSRNLIATFAVALLSVLGTVIWILFLLSVSHTFGAERGTPT